MGPDRKVQVLLLLNNMLSSHGDIVRKATEELKDKWADPDSTAELCNIVVSKQSTMVRKCAANILSMRLGVLAHWAIVPDASRLRMRTQLFAAMKELRKKDDEVLRRGIVRNVGFIMSYEGEGVADWVSEVFDHVEGMCQSSEPDERELGAIVYNLLADAAPTIFVKHIEIVQRIFTRGLEMAEQQGSLVSPFTEQLLMGWAGSISMGHQQLEECNVISKTIPLFIRAARAFAYDLNSERALRGFELLRNLVEFAPELLWSHLQLVLENLLELAADERLHEAARVQAVIYTRRIMLAKRRDIIKLKMMDRVLMVLYGMMAVEPQRGNDGEEMYLGPTNGTMSTLAVAVESTRMLAQKSATSKLATRALRLLKPKLEPQQPAVHRIGVYLFLSMLAEGFTDQLDAKNLRRFVAIVSNGLNDEHVQVRRVAYFALAEFAENLQPEITKLADKVLPMFNQYLDTLSNESRLAARESKTRTRMFYALELFCESLKQEILQRHMAPLMERLLKTAQSQVNSVALRQMSLSAIASVAKVLRQGVKPYFEEMLAIAHPLLIHTMDEDELLLRTHAIQVMNTLSQADPQKFAPLAQELLDFIMEMIKNETDVQFFTYELLGVLSGIIPDQLTASFPLILQHVFSTIDDLNRLGLVEGTCSRCSDGHGDQSIRSELSDEIGTGTDVENEVTEVTEDTEATEATEDAVEGAVGGSSSVESSVCESCEFTDEREEAILCLKAFALNMPETLQPHLAEASKRVLKSCGQLKDYVRRAACETLTEFVLLHWRRGDREDAKHLCGRVMPKLTRYAQDTDDAGHATVALNCLRSLLEEMRGEALARSVYADRVFAVVRSVLRHKMNCQCEDALSSGDDDDEDKERCSDMLHKEHLLLEAAGNLLPAFGHSMRPQQFARYFQTISSRYVRRLRKFKSGEKLSEKRSFIYDVLTRCVAPLGPQAEEYYDVLCTTIVDGILDSNAKVRQHAMLSLTELIVNSNGDNAETTIKTTSGTLIEALKEESGLGLAERERACGVVARMILADYKLMPLDEALPVLYNNLPLRQRTEEYEYVLKALQLLHDVQPQCLEPWLEKTLDTLLQALRQEQLPKPETKEVALNLAGKIKSSQRQIFEQFAEQHPELGELII